MYWPNPDELDDAQVTAAHDLIAQFVAEECPDLNVRRGVVGDLVTGLHAMLQGASMAAIERLRRSLSAMELALDPSLADDAAVDALASNYGVSRRMATKATGTITIVLTRCSGLNFGLNSKFRARGQLFYVSEPISVKPPGSVGLTRHSVAAVERDDGKFTIQVPVVAASMHPDANLKRHDVLVPAIRPVGFDMAYATHDFTGGVAAQSNEELIRQMRTSIATPSFAGRGNIKALVRKRVPDIMDIAVIGAGDPEMTRDAGSDGISKGGRIDIYLRSQPYPAQIGSIALGRLVTKEEKRSVWRVFVDSDAAPGFYHVADAHAVDADLRISDCKVLEETYEQARFSRYQTATLQIEQLGETFGLTEGESFRRFDLTLLAMPHVATIQDYLDGPEIRQPGLDVLVFAAKPAWIKVDVQLRRGAKADKSAIQQAIANYVNGLPIGEAPTDFRVIAAAPDPDSILEVQVSGDRILNRVTAAFLRPEDVTVS